MANNNTINIRFPFKDSPKGYFLDLTTTTDDAIKSNLIHLLMTNKGDRLYLPEFGTNLRQYLFEPNDDISHSGIRSEIEEAVSKFMPKLVVNEVIVEHIENREHSARVRIDYTITEDVFQSRDFVIIEI
jgi:uncharacterized protein